MAGAALVDGSAGSICACANGRGPAGGSTVTGAGASGAPNDKRSFGLAAAVHALSNCIPGHWGRAATVIAIAATAIDVASSVRMNPLAAIMTAPAA
jgi:hypothetical protein